jgi:hypothetical protein
MATADFAQPKLLGGNVTSVLPTLAPPLPFSKYLISPSMASQRAKLQRPYMWLLPPEFFLEERQVSWYADLPTCPGRSLALSATTHEAKPWQRLSALMLLTIDTDFPE